MTSQNNSSNKLQMMTNLRNYIYFFEDLLIYFNFKSKHWKRFINFFLKIFQTDKDYSIDGSPQISNTIKLIKLVFKFEEKSVTFSINLICFLIISYIENEKHDFFESVNSKNELLEYKNIKEKLKVLLFELENLPKKPDSTAAILFPKENKNTEWISFCEKFLEEVSIEELKNYYSTVNTPICIMQRAKWYRISVFSIPIRLNILDLILFIGNLIIDYKRKRKNKDQNQKDTQIVPPISVNDIIFNFLQDFYPNPLKNLKLEQNDNIGNVTENQVDVKNSYEIAQKNIDSFLSRNEIMNSIDLLSQKSKSISRNKLIIEVKRLVIDEESTTFLTENPLFNRLFNTLNNILENIQVKSKPIQTLKTINSPQKIYQLKEQINNITENYLELLSIDEKEDIIRDYLWRFHSYIEENFKKLLKFLSEITGVSKNSDHETLGVTIGRLKQSNNRLLKNLLLIRNAIAHSSFNIELNSQNFEKSKIKFNDRGKTKEFTWKKFVNFAEKWYYIFLSWLEKIQGKLIAVGKIENKDILLDAPNKNFQKEYDKFLKWLKQILKI